MLCHRCIGCSADATGRVQCGLDLGGGGQVALGQDVPRRATLGNPKRHKVPSGRCWVAPQCLKSATQSDMSP
eukprot:scaffold176878_cov24-Tisochrysis_lutea.AAC.1